jgi:hypothetical protein
MIKIIDDFYKQTDVLDDLYHHFYYAGQWQFDFFPHSYVWKEKQSNDLESKICQLIRRLSVKEPTFAGKGYEVWANVLDKDNDHLHHHVDCEEAAQDEIVPAKMTATIYLGSEDDLEGGELVLDTQEYVPSTEFYNNIYSLVKEVKQNKLNNWITIPYKYNRVVLFDGNYPHAVLPIKNIKQGNSRITLTISSWDKKIKVVR